MKTSQKQRLLAYLKQHPINPLEAWQQLGIYRLAAQVHILRDEGHNIKTDLVEVKNRYNEVCKVAKYTLIESES